MVEVTWNAVHTAVLNPGKGRGLVFLGLDITMAGTGDTLTTGLTEISGAGWAYEDAALDADSGAVLGAISGGTITLYSGKISDPTSDVSGPTRLLVMGIVR